MTSGTVINMYGPTETTIWSSTQEVSGDEAAVPIGRPIANTQIYILNSRRQPVPTGVAGELWIAGDGVVRGYYSRNLLVENGDAACRIDFALNDTPGDWTITATDVATGVSGRTVVTLER